MPRTITLPSKHGEPTWEVAGQFPLQGEWTEEAFCRAFPERGYELVDGHVETLPLPNINHQRIAGRLFPLVRAAAAGLGGETLFMGTRLRVPRAGGSSGLREPDVLHVTDAQLAAAHRQFVHGAEWAAEIVSSPDGRTRDLVEKRGDYAAAGVKEYWIIDPRDRLVTVLILDGDDYREHGRFGDGEAAAGVLLPGLAVGVTDLLGPPED